VELFVVLKVTFRVKLLSSTQRYRYLEGVTVLLGRPVIANREAAGSSRIPRGIKGIR